MSSEIGSRRLLVLSVMVHRYNTLIGAYADCMTSVMRVSERYKRGLVGMRGSVQHIYSHFKPILSIFMHYTGDLGGAFSPLGTWICTFVGVQSEAMCESNFPPPEFPPPINIRNDILNKVPSLAQWPRSLMRLGRGSGATLYFPRCFYG